MKCLTVGMNPDCVLSEEERKKRFRRINNFGGGDDEDTLLFQTAPGPESSSPQKCSSSIVRNETSGYPARSFQHLNTENYGIKQGQVSLLGNNNFSVFRSEPGPSLPHAGIRSSPTLDTIEATIKTESFNKSAARDVVHPTMGQETEEIYDQGMVMFSAFDDIETKDFNENSSSDSDLEIYATDTLLTVSLQEEEIARIVRDHDLVYFSVNFGEVLIKEMLMCSMFGVQVRGGMHCGPRECSSRYQLYEHLFCMFWASN